MSDASWYRTTRLFPIHILIRVSTLNGLFGEDEDRKSQRGARPTSMTQAIHLIFHVAAFDER